MIMSEVDFERRIFHELDSIRAELKDIREHMVDADTILTEEERNLVEESFKHEKQGKLVSLSDFKKKL
ncbi:hypothetical protein METP3_01948 [Methanosarcinales archaeon]|nr:hypothetical protein METP3_01948 [Methanosarcinales archaeon]